MNDHLAALGLIDDEAIIVDVAALHLASLDHPDVDLANYLALLDSIAERVEMLASVAKGAAARGQILSRVLAEEFGFTGDQDNYDDPDNADLIRVLDRRRGLPVSLSILYVAAARKVGWEANALNTPGHVLVRLGSPAKPLLLDPFHDGRTLDHEELAELLTIMLGVPTLPSPEHLVSMGNRSILVRLLMNQATRAEAAGQLERALTLYERLTLIAPSTPPLWWDRARLEVISGEPGRARSSLSAMLEVTRDARMRAHIHSALDALSG